LELIAQNQKQIDQVTRLNELDTRQVSIRQKALDILGKKEKSVNDLYNNRTKALDAVAQAAKIVDQKITVANLRLQAKAKRKAE
jgi:hypothetical protein